MTPLDLILWALAAGATIIIIGTALAIAFAVVNPNLPPGPGR